jgi:2-polyprenyl-3-methyl-5-hydroxy-6-metoxy-1,4-benzoquinol methylase
MSICAECCCGTNRFFSRMSSHFDRQYQKRGLEKIQRSLVNSLRPEIQAGSSVLDIGCGVGALHFALLTEGAERAIGVEISEGMIEHARRHAEELGFTDRTRYLQGDFVERQDEVNVSDVVLMDKVVCCYPDLERLLDSALGKTARLLALTHPRNNFLATVLFKAHIFLGTTLHLSFHPFWHDWRAMHRGILARGFELIHADSSVIWSALVYRRTRPESAADAVHS